MVKYLLVVVAVGLIYWVHNMRKKKVFRRHRVVERRVTKISGSEVQTFLDGDTPLECLLQDGIRFGESFKLKEAPTLPHNDHCRCVIDERTFSSEDVFKGVLREGSGRESVIGTLNDSEAQALKKMLLSLQTDSLPENFESFWEKFDHQCWDAERTALVKKLIQQKLESLSEKESLSDVPLDLKEEQ